MLEGQALICLKPFACLKAFDSLSLFDKPSILPVCAPQCCQCVPWAIHGRRLTRYNGIHM